MAICCHATAASAEVKMRARSVERCGDVGVPGQVLAEHVLVGRGDHVRLIVVGSVAADPIRRDQSAVVVLTRIARRAEGVRPAKVHAVLFRELLAREGPRPPAGSLVLELEIARHVASHMLDDGADGRPGVELVKRADLGGVLIRDILATQRTRKGVAAGSWRPGAVVMRPNMPITSLCRLTAWCHS